MGDLQALTPAKLLSRARAAMHRSKLTKMRHLGVGRHLLVIFSDDACGGGYAFSWSRKYSRVLNDYLANRDQFLTHLITMCSYIDITADITIQIIYLQRKNISKPEKSMAQET